MLVRSAVLVIFASLLHVCVSQTDHCCSDPCPGFNQTCQWTECGFLCIDLGTPFAETLASLRKHEQARDTDPMRPVCDLPPGVNTCQPFNQCSQYSTDKPLMCKPNIVTGETRDGNLSYVAGDYCRDDPFSPLCVPFNHCDGLDEGTCVSDGRCKWRKLSGRCNDFSRGWCATNPDILPYPTCEDAMPMHPICVQDTSNEEVYFVHDGICTPPGFNMVPCEEHQCGEDRCALHVDSRSCSSDDSCAWKTGEACCGHVVGFCQSAETMCTQAFTCAHSPSSQKAYQFDDGCIPRGWAHHDPSMCDCKEKCTDYRTQGDCTRDGCEWKVARSCEKPQMGYCREPAMPCGRMRTCASSFWAPDDAYLFQDTCLPMGYSAKSQEDCICTQDVCQEEQKDMWRVSFVLLIDDLLTEEQVRELLSTQLGIAMDSICARITNVPTVESVKQDNIAQKLSMSFKYDQEAEKEEMLQKCESMISNRGYDILSSKVLAPGEVEQAQTISNGALRLKSWMSGLQF